MNTRSSTDNKLELVDAYMTEVLWSLYFIQAQGYGIYTDVHQDNVSAQMLETNGKLSSSRKTKNIKSKFFFIKDKVYREEINIVDCPAGVMWADQKNEGPVDELFHGVHIRGRKSNKETQNTAWPSISSR